MAKLTHQQITDEAEKLGYELIDDKDYTNMNSRILIRCKKGHLIETCMGDLRKPSFVCPVCDKSISFINPTVVPSKRLNTYRIIAVDQATEHFGLSIYDDGKLVFYSLYTFTGTMIARITKIRKFLNDIVIKCWQPDFFMMEDIQYQNNGLMTFKVLAMLLGVVQEVCSENDVEFECVSPNVWRKYAGTCGKTRNEEKKLSIAVVKEKFNVSVSDDVAEAILIGHYGARMHKKEIPLAFGSK